jgi:hypothetical protein
MQTAQLIPVSEWVCDLYKVDFYKGEQANGGRVIKTLHIAASSSSHLASEANEAAPSDCDEFCWTTVKEDVGPPAVVGTMYGIKVYESGMTFGRRLASKL